MNLRHSAAVLAAAAVIASAGPALAADPSPSAAVPDGLYGTSDPTYDGVWRQSTALIVQREQGVTPADEAVAWLVGQQCANGAFPAFRADTSKDCDASTEVDTNSTAAALQALDAVGGHDSAAKKALGWLKSVQNEDGGWGYSAGGASDANSTSVVIGALAATGEDPARVRKGGRTPYDALLDLALPCTGEDAGAFAYQPDKKGQLAANADATAAAVVGALGLAATDVEPAKGSAEPSCAKASDAGQAARNGASYLVRAMGEGHHLVSTLPGAEDQPDYGNTADAVVALAAAGFGTQAAEAGRWLAENARDWARNSGPAGYAQLVLAARAAGLDPRDFGGTDLVAALNATGPSPKAGADASPAAGGKDDKDDKDAKAEKKDGDKDGVSVWWIIAVGAVAGIGIGFLFSGRGKGRRS